MIFGIKINNHQKPFRVCDGLKLVWNGSSGFEMAVHFLKWGQLSRSAVFEMRWFSYG